VDSESAQTSPSGQQPTSPSVLLSATIWHVAPVAQQLSGRSIDVQADVPDGHWNPRFSNRCQPANRASRRPGLDVDVCECLRTGWLNAINGEAIVGSVQFDQFDCSSFWSSPPWFMSSKAQ
jgi:hypothetical protein